ncbi:hypothetical protein LOTGIDRAFT_165992 [Lottia gigantea]|uniref:Uncharacterized protein n=1 Tax=Lottia gigantea TaxID=225164 RepID=V3ZUD8_LOTGI|nr:hypothetical protein LOTGIDRAFT_165992 [Lottia gigantea]ESO87972.1 hypothetical protein LOTGIDRAFT_165992 [Lottia gigantea]
MAFTGLDDFQDTSIFFDIKFGDIKIKLEDCMLRPLGSNCVVNEHGEAGLNDTFPGILCNKEKPFKPHDSVRLIVKKQGAVSYWFMELLITSFDNSCEQKESKKSIWYLNSKEGQFDFYMDENYTVRHNGSDIFTFKDKVPLKLWFKIFRAEVTMQTLGENDALGHYNRHGKSPNNVNPDDSHASSSSAGQHSVDQTHTKQLF